MTIYELLALWTEGLLVRDEEPGGYVNGTRVNNDEINIILGR